MGRQGPKLVPFLQNGFINRKYRNLILEDTLGLMFSIVLPHKTKKLDREDELIFKDWYALNGKKYIFASKHYTDAKQAMTASLRKSDYVEKVHVSDDKLTYRILSKEEVKEKKKLKKDLKKKNELKTKALDSEDNVSSEESGYGSGADSPLNDYPLIPINDNLTTPCGEESSQTSQVMELDSSFGINDVLESSCQSQYNGFIKSEPVDAYILAENSLTDPNYSTGIQNFADNLKSGDYFPENSPQLDLMECFSVASELASFTEEIPAVNKYDILQMDVISNDDLSKELFDDFLTNFNSSFMHEGNVNNQEELNQLSETQKVNNMSTETEDFLTEELFRKLMEDDSFSNSGNNKKEISTPNADMLDHKTEANENIYYCKKCVHLGKIPILFCEPQFENRPTKTLGEIKIAFEESVLNEIHGFKSVMEYKFINDHLMVILEPNDD